MDRNVLVSWLRAGFSAFMVARMRSAMWLAGVLTLAACSEYSGLDVGMAGASGATGGGSSAVGASGGGGALNAGSSGSTAEGGGGVAAAAGGAGGASVAGSGGGGGGGAVAGAGSGGGGGSAGTAPVVDRNASGTIVVLGSSTAAGTGPSKLEFSWVERYRAYLKTEYPGFKLINLAVGGYTTYQVQPTGFAAPAGRPKPEAAHNITQALESAPDAILINLPTNDAANDIPVAEQMTNFARVTELAQKLRVPCWVSTSQPRKFAEESRRQLLMGTRDAIKAKYGEYTLDFWTQFAKADGTTKAEYDAGDGIHMNDAAHALLVEQVIAAKVPEAVLTGRR